MKFSGERGFSLTSRENLTAEPVCRLSGPDPCIKGLGGSVGSSGLGTHFRYVDSTNYILF